MMHTQTIIAPDSRSALERVTMLMGPDAVIFSTRKTARGVEITAGVQKGVGPATPLRPRPALQPGIQASLQPDPQAQIRVAVPQPQPAFQAQPQPQFASQARDPMVRFIEQARTMGIDPETLSIELAGGESDLGDVWARFLMRVERDIAIAPPPTRDLAHLCVVGDGGSAKTTTLAQLASRSRADWPSEPIALLAGDTRPGAREQLQVIARMLNLSCVEPKPGETLVAALARHGANRRIFIDMPSDPRLAAHELISLRGRFGGAGGGLNVLCTLPLTGQLARHRQVAALFENSFDGYVITHAGEILPPGAVITMLLESGMPLSSIGRSSDFLGGIEPARNTSLCRMAVQVLAAAGSGNALQ